MIPEKKTQTMRPFHFLPSIYVVHLTISTAFVTPESRTIVPSLVPTFSHQAIGSKNQRDSALYRELNSNESNEQPPHTALAQVLANQYNIDLSSVESMGKSQETKITAADVEFHRYKLSQPPCTPQALELAYSYGLDLNVLREDYADSNETENGQVNYIRISDVELLKDNLRSLLASRQRVKGEETLPADVRRKQQHLNELERRIEKNVGRLSDKALQAVGSVADILQNISSKVKIPLPGVQRDIFSTNDSKIDSIYDFDQDLADEIQAALASAGVDNQEAMNLVSLLAMPVNNVRTDTEANGSNDATSSCNDHLKGGKIFFFADLK